ALDSSGVIDAGLTATFKLAYTSDPSSPTGTALIRLATPSSLKQDITLSGKINWLGGKHVVKEFLKKADKIEDAVTK
ncbi:MAG: hypothetical protein HY884_09165, partial [Deltaproteobacteria bacterium]|nr:hypothetical protein [Deltaproteobacteria bacterium]